MNELDGTPHKTASFFDRPEANVEIIPVGPGIPLGIEQISNPQVGIGGAYGSWGESYSNEDLHLLIEERLGEPLSSDERMNLSELGFDYRHHIAPLTKEQHIQVEEEVGARYLRAAAQANGWKPEEIQAVLIGVSGPPTENYLERIAQKAGIPDGALKVSIHKACDGSAGGLNLALNPDQPENRRLPLNLARELLGKKVLVGGIEGLSRWMGQARDINALQLFGNGAGVIGFIPGQSMKLLVGGSKEVFDEEGLLQVQMVYPHTGFKTGGQSLLDISSNGLNHFRIAGLMHEPQGGQPVLMAGLMGMVKLFVRSGVQVVREVCLAYQERMADMQFQGKGIAVTIAHHANLKINQLKDKHLQREGINVPMPWLLRDFGNVSAASVMIAFLRQLPELKPGEHILIDGFGAGTYYDVMAIEMGG